MKNFAKSDDDEQLKAERVWDKAKAEAIRDEMSRQARHRHGGKQADDFDVAAAL